MVIERFSRPRIIDEISDSPLGKYNSIKNSLVERSIPKERFTIRKRSSNQKIPCEIGYLDNSFLKGILDIQELILQDLLEAEFFKPSSREDFSEHFRLGNPIL
jgi:hypothetical protein